MDVRIIVNGNELLYSSATDDERSALINPQVKAEIGKAGSLTFTILPTHPMYDSLKPFKTFLTVTIDGTEVFKGRVLDMSKDMYNQKSVMCEGDLTFLMDSVCTPGDYNETVAAFFRRCIGWHNTQVEAAKQLTVGKVSTKAAGTKVEFDISNYTTIADTIETEIIGYYGGYLHTRTEVDSTGKEIRYVDLIKEGDYDSTQVIEYGSQILDLTNDESANDLFTILLAVGDSDSQNGKDYTFPTVRMTVDEAIPDANAIATYGQITHVESFSGVSDTGKLSELADQYIRTHYTPYPTELTIKAIDLHILDGTIETIQVGDTVQIRSTPHNLSKKLMCISIDYDLQNPENTSYVFGHPKQSLSQRYNKEKKTEKAQTSKSTKRGTKSRGAVKQEVKDRQDGDEAVKKDTEQKYGFVNEPGGLILKINNDESNFTIEANKVTITGEMVVNALAKMKGVRCKGLTVDGSISATGTINSSSTVYASKGFKQGYSDEEATWHNVTVVKSVSASTNDDGLVTSVDSDTVKIFYLGEKPY